MSKTIYTTHNVFRLFGIKVFEYYSDFLGNETEEDFETMQDDIILHENNVKRRMQK